MSNALALALAWAARGVKVFPLGPNKMPLANCRDCRKPGHQPAGCECPSQGRPCHAFYAATTDTALLRRMFSRAGADCVGISTGASGLLVVDCDIAKGSHKPLRWTPDGVDRASGQHVASTRDLFEGEDFCTTQAEADRIRQGVDVYSAALAHRDTRHVDTWTVLTPSGGVHYVYASVDADCFAPDNRSLPLVDVKTGGSYVVAAGSVTDKGTYRHVRGAWPPAQAPQWLVDHLDRPSRRSRRLRADEVRKGAGGVVVIEVDQPEAYVEKILDNAVQALRSAPLGQVYDMIRRKTFSLAPLVKGGSLTADLVVGELTAAVPTGAENRAQDVRRCLEGALPQVHAEKVVLAPQQAHDVEEFEVIVLENGDELVF